MLRLGLVIPPGMNGISSLALGDFNSKGRASDRRISPTVTGYREQVGITGVPAGREAGEEQQRQRHKHGTVWPGRVQSLIALSFLQLIFRRDFSLGHANQDNTGWKSTDAQILVKQGLTYQLWQRPFQVRVIVYEILR